MLLIQPRGGGKKQYRYGGSGIFDSLTRKLFSSGVKNVINTATKSAIAQKVANAVVNGAASTAENVAKEAVNSIKQKALNRKKQGRKRPPPIIEQPQQEVKKAKVDINSLINGSGIVLD